MKSPSRARFMLFASITVVMLASACQLDESSVLGNYVWLDEDGDGIQSEEEKGVPGVVVELIRSDIATSMRTTTGNDGFYAFKNMDTYNYILKFHPPSGFGFSLTDQGTDDSLDSDANQEDGTTIEFFYEKGKDDGRWDAGLIKTGPAPTATPTPTATPKPSSTPDPAQEVYDDPNLSGSSLIGFSEFADIDMINLSGSFMGMSLDDDHPLPNSLPFYLVDPVGRLYFGLLGDTQGLSANISIFRPGDSQFQPTIFSNVDTGTAAEPVRPSFEDKNVTDSESEGYCASDNALLADTGQNVADLEPVGGHSIWVYKLKPSGDGYDLVHVSLTREQVQAVLDAIVAAMTGGPPAEPRPFIFGTVRRSVGGEIVEVTPEEAAASVLAQLFPDIASMMDFGMLEFMQCVQLMVGR